MTPIRITETARGEIERAAAWYEGQREGLGIKFTDRVLETIDRIAANPVGYRKVVGEARRATVHKFPYALWFKLNEDGSLVIACLHAKRSSALAKERAGGVIPFPER